MACGWRTVTVPLQNVGHGNLIRVKRAKLEPTTAAGEAKKEKKEKKKKVAKKEKVKGKEKDKKEEVKEKKNKKKKANGKLKQ